MEDSNENNIPTIKEEIQQDKTQKRKILFSTPENINKKPRKNKSKFIYGNYNSYYGYRQQKNMKDSRLTLMEKEWFQGKKCLDIGCNVGTLTIEIASSYSPSSIIGIDIDEKLIQKASNILHNKNERAKRILSYPISFEQTLGPLENKPKYLPQISFQHGNFLETEINEKFDTITCLSTTKWIHYNWGDEGIKNLFTKIYENLNDGGLFLLEPQLWNTYKKKSTLTQEIKKQYNQIKLKPEQFSEYLTTTLKFTFVKSIDIPLETVTAEGFARPMFLFKK